MVSGHRVHDPGPRVHLEREGRVGRRRNLAVGRLDADAFGHRIDEQVVRDALRVGASQRPLEQEEPALLHTLHARQPRRTQRRHQGAVAGGRRVRRERLDFDAIDTHAGILRATGPILVGVLSANAAADTTRNRRL